MTPRHILAMYARATDEERHAGALWYRDAQDIALSIASARGMALDTVAGVIAALSPQVAWEDNIDAAREIIRTGKLKRYGGYRANVRKAERILAGEIPDSVLGGRKVRAFYRLVRDGGNALDVAIDSHAVSVADGKHYLWKQGPRLRSAKQYNARARAYWLAGIMLGGVSGHQVQATTWLTWKRVKHES